MTHPQTILVVDDDLTVRNTLRVFLSRLQYDVQEAACGADALAACATSQPALVLLDIGLPDMTGIEVCARLKASPDTRELPVIFLSGRPDLEDKLNAFTCGGVDYITKPFQADEIRARINTHLTLRAQQLEQQRINAELGRALAQAEALNQALSEVNERLKASESLKTRFLAILRNELNDPLNVILAMGNQLAEGHLAPEQAAQLGIRIRREATGLDFQFRNLFMVADLEAGMASPCPVRLDLDDLMGDVMATFQHVADEAGQTLRYERFGERTFITDADMLHIIAANMLSNALKFGPPGSLIHVQCHGTQETLALIVDDEGPGIPESLRQEAFQGFFHLSAGLDRPHRGQGLGLSLIRGLLDLLDGDVQLLKAPAGGLRCHVSIPVPSGPDVGEGMGDGLTIFDDCEPR